MKNIHVLPTDKPSRLSIIDSQLIYSKEYFINAQNIYITSDEEPKVNNFYFDFEYQKVRKCETGYYNKGSKKIILTTDQDLIKDGVWGIEDEFLEWFVKNPSCETVEVDRDEREVGNHLGGVVTEYGDYKIIIPKEEPKQEFPQFGTKEFNDLASTYFGGKPKQETTLEEFIKKQLSLGKYQDQESAIRHSIELGAKWQQEQIGKSEFLQRLRATKSDAEARRLILEQFKNK